MYKNGAARVISGWAEYAGDAATVNGHTVAVDVPSGAKFTDTTYTSKTAASGGTDTSLVTTGEKYTWNAKTNTRVKGNAETSYRTGDVNLTPANIGAAASDHSHTTVNGHTVNADVPSDAKFTDTIYTHPSYTAKSSGLYKVTVDSTGHVSGTAAVAKADITALGIPAQDTTYSSKAAASGGTDVSLVTTGEKATWNAKTSNAGTVTSVATGVGLTGGTITGSGTIKAKLRSETALTRDSVAAVETADRVYPVVPDKSGYLAVTVPWTTGDSSNAVTGVKGNAETTYRTGNVNLTAANIGAAASDHSHTTVNGHTVNADVPSGAKFTDTTYSSKAAASGGTDVSLVTTGEKYTWNSKTSNTGTVTSVATGVGLTGGSITTSGTIKAKLRSETALTRDSAAATETADRVYPVVPDKSGYLAVNVPWTDTNTQTITGVKGNSESSYRTGNVNLTAANIGAAAASHTHSPDQLTAGYIRNAVYISHHPEGSGKATFPFLYNDLAHLVRRGGAYTVYTTTATDYTPSTIASTAVSTDLTNAFDGSPSYATPNRATTDKLVIDITCPYMFTYSNVFYIDFGSDGWRAKSITLLVMNNNTETKYTQKDAVTGWAWGHYQKVGLSHTSTNTSGTTVQGFNKIRIVLTDFYSSMNRIAQIGVINYGSAGVRVPYMSRGVDDDVYRSIHPATSGTYSLGTSSKKWADGYFTTLYGSGANLTSLNGSNISSGTVAAARIASLDASKIGSGTFDAARIPSLDASKIGSGTLAAARLPAMGGASSSAAGT